MINWIAQGLLDSAGFILSWLIAPETPQFAVMQGSLALVLLVSVVAVVALWPTQWTILLKQLHKKGLKSYGSAFAPYYLFVRTWQLPLTTVTRFVLPPRFAAP